MAYKNLPISKLPAPWMADWWMAVTGGWETLKGLSYDVCKWLASLAGQGDDFWGPVGDFFLDWLNDGTREVTDELVVSSDGKGYSTRKLNGTESEYLGELTFPRCNYEDCWGQSNLH